MTWDEFYGKVKTTVGKAADKINQTTDLATLQVKLSMAEHKLKDAYAELGRSAYKHFSEEDSSADAVAASMSLVDEALKAVDEAAAKEYLTQYTCAQAQKSWDWAHYMISKLGEARIMDNCKVWNDENEFGE